MIASAALKKAAGHAGMDLVAAVPVDVDLHLAVSHYAAWLDNGYAGEMHYLRRPDAVEKRADPRLIFPEAKTVVVAAASYAQTPPQIRLPKLHGQVAMYAWGDDYHYWLLECIRQLVRNLDAMTATSLNAKIYVDTGPVLERTWALLGGLGWIGKNACLINPHFGSWLFLAVVLVDVEIEPSRMPTAMPSCGSCTRCLDACPTGALVAHGVVDARKCLSYLTIENRGEIPATYRHAIGESLFGCDMCQKVCPWNAQPQMGMLPLSAQNYSLNLVDALFLDQGAFRQRFRHSPIWRGKPDGLARNAAVVLGNLGELSATPHLQRVIAEHPSGMVIEHARWALKQLT